ncbi:FecR domain-containing protein [Bacteroidota bacterium]
MKQKNKHIDLRSKQEKDADDFFSKAGIEYKASKEEIWEKLSSKLDKNPDKKIILKPYRLFFRVAAIFLVLISITAFLRFYTKTIVCPKGEHISALLPDNSLVELNAQSTLKYNPLWWPLSRQVNFEGEGFFNVAKGEKFKVSSEIGTTIVLGTKMMGAKCPPPTYPKNNYNYFPLILWKYCKNASN